MKLECTYKIGITDIGFNNQITNLAILRFLEEIGCTHSDKWGYGVNNIEKNKKVWILMDWKLKVLDRPIYGEKITIKTWARPLEKHYLYTYRDFEVFKGKKKVAIATSKWVLYDIEKNKIIKMPQDIIDNYSPEEDNVFEEKEISKLKETKNSEITLKYEVRRFDIDVNKHMHNLNYLKLAYEALPEEVFLKEEKNNIRIMYKNQILLGETVICRYSRVDNKEIITIKDNEDKKIHAIIELS